MRFEHPAHPELGLRLGYGQNLYPSEDVEGVFAGLAAVAVPLRARLAGGARGFGVGAWLPARAALELDADEARSTRLCDFLASAGLDPFTFNAFPYGGFHRAGLKERVFAPTWLEPERLAFTLAVARLAARVRVHAGGSRPGQHLSVSTHAGQFGPAEAPGDRARCAANLVAAALALARLEQDTGERVVLSIEPEPRSSANDTHALGPLFAELRGQARARAGPAVERHLGACLDTCHAAVEFERPEEAFERATAAGTVLGKLQFSSALALPDPDRDPRGRERFLDMAEPIYLHQVTGRAARGPGLARALDLPEVRERHRRGEAAWRGSCEWRCHFHVPVDLERFGGEAGLGLRTTRAEAEAALRAALSAPERWGSNELHVEIETYTWSLFSAAGTSAAELVDGLEREWRHVQARLEEAGWRPAAGVPAAPR